MPCHPEQTAELPRLDISKLETAPAYPVAMGEIEVQWVQVRTSRGTPLERWEAHLIKPMRSLEFAWIYRHDAWWHLEILLEDFNVRRVAKFVKREKGMHLLERWIVSRWKRTIPDWGVEDPRGRTGRQTWPGEKHRLALGLSRAFREKL